MSLSHFTLSGSTYEQGVAHGKLLKESIKNNLEVYISRFKKEAGINKKDLLTNTSIYFDILRKQSPEYVNGINGIATGSNINLIEIAMLNLRYELLYHALGKRYINEAIDGCTSFALLPESTENHNLIIGQNWDWIPDIECVLITSIDIDGLKRLSFTEAGIFGGKPGMNSGGIGLVVNGMYTTKDDFSRFEKPFHLRCYEVLRSQNMHAALEVLTNTPRSCTANFIIGESPQRVVNIELAPDIFRLIDTKDGILSHANHFDNPEILGIKEPPNPNRYLSEFRQKRMECLLNYHKPCNLQNLFEVLIDHENFPQSLCRHRDKNLLVSQHTITKTSMIMDLNEKSMWVTDGQPCKNGFDKFNLQ